ncbi:MAG: hypothetical protein E7036_01895 [Opitutales bacterium]|nr:hypothetical protein [Opitutales bacterium]
MAYQLIYTSYPKSLTVGRTGFSVVARSKAMSERLASAVERCSIFDIGTGEIFSHRILSLSGEVWHVLTRTKDSGVDYTNRNNYIAHHLVISNSEIQNLANPAEILLQWNGWKDSWNCDPCYVDDVIDLDKIKTSNSLPAKNWQNIFGSPAKASLLFKENVVLSAQPKDARTLLNLYSESLLLNVNAQDAWQTTFTTSFSTSENPNDFSWRAIPNCDNAPINLSTRTAPTALDSRASQYATTGVMNNRERLNLQVKAPTPQMRFKVVESKPESSSSKLIYVASAVVSLVALLVVLYFIIEIFLPSESQPTEVPQPLPKLETSNISGQEQPKENQEPKATMTLLDTINLAREKIQTDNYEDALSIWDNSAYAKKEPSLREDLLSDIGARIDVLLRFVENVLSLQEQKDGIYETAIENLSKAKRALDIQAIPQKEKRLAKWENLNKKIRK